MTDLPATRFSIGLTGGIGSGKSTVADLFAANGAAVVDTDLIAHQLTAPDGLAIPAIRKAFGDAFILADGALDRSKMRQQVFADSNAKLTLEAILHPLIRKETEREADESTGSYLIFVVPLLVESGLWKNRVSRVLVVDCPEDVQIRRVMQRNSLSEEQVRAIMASQVSRDIRLAAADDVIINQNEAEDLPPQVEKLHQRYLALASKAN